MKGDTPVSNINYVRRAANLTPHETLNPIEGFVHNRLEEYLVQNDVPVEMILHLRRVYILGLGDAAVRLCELMEVEP
jgi:hypothetical protein